MVKLGAFGGHKSNGTAKRGMAKLVSGIPFLLLALAAWAVALAGEHTPPLLFLALTSYVFSLPRKLPLYFYELFEVKHDIHSSVHATSI